MKKYIYIIVALLATMSVRAEELLNYPLDTINGEEVYRYQVDKGIGLYRIGVNFNVSQSEIVRLNPQLRERGLHYAEILLIPTGRPVVKETKPQVVETVVTEEQVVVAEKPAEEKPVKEKPLMEKPVMGKPVEEKQVAERLHGYVEPVVADTLIAQDTIAAAVADTTAQDTVAPDTRRVIELALMLPFESQQTKRSGNAERMMEFYQGALLALRDLQNDSTLYRLRVYDTERSERKVQALCDSTELDSVKGILGLVYPIQIERMIPWCEAHNVPLFLPFSDDVELKGHPHVYQFNSPDTEEAKALTSWMQAHDSTTHRIVVEVRENDLAQSIRTLRKQMKEAGLSYTGLALRDLMNDTVVYALDYSKENVIILHSDRFQHVRMLLPHLTKIRDAGYRIRIVSQYSWQKEKVDLPQIYTSKFNIGDEHAVYDAIWAEHFTNSHVSEMPRYDLLGYDLMREMVHVINHEAGEESLLSPIIWESASEADGWQNTYIQVIEK